MNIAYCFDLDGTLTSTEILPSIAAELGISQEISTLTRLTMEGQISFEESLRLRTAILGRVPIKTVHEIIDDIPLNEPLMDFIQSKKKQCFIVTGNLDIWVNKIISDIGCNAYTSHAHVSSNTVSLKKVLNKKDAVHAIRNKGFNKIISIGDGSNDVPMFQSSDIAIAFGGVHNPTWPAIYEADYVVYEGDRLCRLLSML